MGQDKPSTSLAVLAQEYAAIEQELLSLEGELTQDIDQRLGALTANIETKVDSIAYVLDRLERESEALKDRARQYNAAAKRIQSAHERLKAYTKGVMVSNAIREIQGDAYRFLISNAKPKLTIVDEKSIPEEFWVETISRSIDRSLVESAIENGIDVPGTMVEPTNALRISVPKGRK